MIRWTRQKSINPLTISIVSICGRFVWIRVTGRFLPLVKYYRDPVLARAQYQSLKDRMNAILQQRHDYA